MYGPTAVWRVWNGVTSTFHDGSDKYAMASRIAEIQLSHFDGGMLPLPLGDDSEVLVAGCIATAGLPKARSCIVSLYNMDRTTDQIGEQAVRMKLS